MAKTETTLILSNRLEELTEKKRDENPKLSNKVQAAEMNIPYQTFNKYLHDNAECNISYLKVMAKYFDVSTDYLLGYSDVATNDTDLRTVCDYSGLSEGALQTLTTYKEFPLDARLDTLNALLENADFTRLLSLITEKISIETDTLSISHAGLHTQATNNDVIDYAASNLLKKITDDLRESIPKEKTQNGKFLAKWEKATKKG